MSITWSAGIRVVDTTTGSASKAITLPSDVPAGATVIVGLLDRTDITTTLLSTSDPVNGSWPGAGIVQGPINGGPRGWLLAFNNSAALVGVGDRTVTVTTSIAMSSIVIAP